MSQKESSCSSPLCDQGFGQHIQKGYSLSDFPEKLVLNRGFYTQMEDLTARFADTKRLNIVPNILYQK